LPRDVARPLHELADTSIAGVWPIDRITAAYLLVSGSALFFPHRPSSWIPLAFAHLAGALLLLRPGPLGTLGRSLTSRFGRITRVLHHWYPLIVMPFLYAELPLLNGAVHDGRYFDSRIIGIEQSVFSGQPSRDFAHAAPHLWISELLHAAYFSYYIIIYAPPLILYLMGRREQFRRALVALMAAFFVHYVFFVYFPVQGPRYLYPNPVAEGARGPVWHLVQSVLEAGASRGAAFPSSHVGVAVAQTLNMFFYLPVLGPLLAPLSVGLALGAVYGGYHYATDAVLGALLGGAVALFAWRFLRRGDRAKNLRT
jgi:membrane-associated phospholipid phosphatase